MSITFRQACEDHDILHCNDNERERDTEDDNDKVQNDGSEIRNINKAGKEGKETSSSSLSSSLTSSTSFDNIKGLIPTEPNILPAPVPSPISVSTSATATVPIQLPIQSQPQLLPKPTKAQSQSKRKHYNYKCCFQSCNNTNTNFNTNTNINTNNKQNQEERLVTTLKFHRIPPPQLEELPSNASPNRIITRAKKEMYRKLLLDRCFNNNSSNSNKKDLRICNQHEFKREKVIFNVWIDGECKEMKMIVNLPVVKKEEKKVMMKMEMNINYNKKKGKEMEKQPRQGKNTSANISSSTGTNSTMLCQGQRHGHCQGQVQIQNNDTSKLKTNGNNETSCLIGGVTTCIDTGSPNNNSSSSHENVPKDILKNNSDNGDNSDNSNYHNTNTIVNVKPKQPKTKKRKRTWNYRCCFGQCNNTNLDNVKFHRIPPPPHKMKDLPPTASLKRRKTRHKQILKRMLLLQQCGNFERDKDKNDLRICDAHEFTKETIKVNMNTDSSSNSYITSNTDNDTYVGTGNSDDSNGTGSGICTTNHATATFTNTGLTKELTLMLMLPKKEVFKNSPLISVTSPEIILKEKGCKTGHFFKLTENKKYTSTHTGTSTSNKNSINNSRL